VRLVQRHVLVHLLLGADVPRLVVQRALPGSGIHRDQHVRHVEPAAGPTVGRRRTLQHGHPAGGHHRAGGADEHFQQRRRILRRGRGGHLPAVPELLLGVPRGIGAGIVPGAVHHDRATGRAKEGPREKLAKHPETMGQRYLSKETPLTFIE